MKSSEYKKIIDFAKEKSIKYCVINECTEIDPCFDFNNLPLIDTETFEIPCCFEVDRALVLCFPSPHDMTPEDTGKSYQTYYDYVDQLRKICRPQYIALEGAYVKLMVWCDWSVSGDAEIEFYNCCNEAVKKIQESTPTNMEFHVCQPNDHTPAIFQLSEIDIMYSHIMNKPEFNCEIHMNLCNIPKPTNHGVKSEMYGEMRLFEVY